MPGGRDLILPGEKAGEGRWSGPAKFPLRLWREVFSKHIDGQVGVICNVMTELDTWPQHDGEQA